VTPAQRLAATIAGLCEQRSTLALLSDGQLRRLVRLASPDRDTELVMYALVRMLAGPARRGRRQDAPEVRRAKRDHLQRRVIRAAEEGWRRWPVDGPTRGFVAERLAKSETALRHQLRRGGLDFETLSAQARDRVSGRSWTQSAS
jgi:hypothetical protein